MPSRPIAFNTLVRLSAPILLIRLLIPVRGLILTGMFAALGNDALAAGALALSLLVAFWTFFLGVLTASVGVSVAHALGEQNHYKLHEALHTGFWLSVLLAMPAILILYCSGPFLLYLGQDASIAHQASRCAQGLAWTLLPCGMLLSANVLFTNLKRPHIPMLYGMGSLFLTVFLGAVFAFGQYGFPRMGIAGIGWGMTTAQGVQAIVLFIHLYYSPQTRTFVRFSWLVLPRFDRLFSFWKHAWPLGLKYSMEFFLFFLLAVMLGAFHQTALSVYQVILQCFMLTSCLSSGVGMVTVALVGQALGAKEYSDAIKICFLGLLWGLCVVGFVSLLITLFPRWLAHYFFQPQSAAFALFITTIGWVVSFQLLDGIRKVMTHILISFRDVRFPLLSEVIGLWGISLPFAYVVGKPFGLTGVLMGLLIGLLISVLMMCWRFQYCLRNVSIFVTQVTEN